MLLDYVWIAYPLTIMFQANVNVASARIVKQSTTVNYVYLHAIIQ